MISETKLRYQLMRERSRWNLMNLKTDFIRGTMSGLAIAISELDTLSTQARLHRAEYKGRLTKWKAAEFRHCIDKALSDIKRGDRGKAIVRMENALEHHFDESDE